MAKFVLMFHGGETSEEPSSEVMDRWMAWFGELGEAVVDMGAPFGATATIASDGTPSEGRAGRTRRMATRSSRQPIFTMPSSWPWDVRG
jgi:hypothetical protein